MLRVGIPNRSSLLHVAGASLCIRANLIEACAYEPPCLFYKKNDITVLLTRCDELCRFFAERKLDVILTGFDYAVEHLNNLWAFETPCDVFRTAFALLGAPERVPETPQVVTKFPRHAAAQLAAWGVEARSIRAMTGGVEGVCALDASVVAFDVICTGATVKANGLNVYRQEELRPPLWLSYAELPSTIEQALSDSALMERLRRFYRHKLSHRDSAIAEAVMTDLDIRVPT